MREVIILRKGNNLRSKIVEFWLWPQTLQKWNLEHFATPWVTAYNSFLMELNKFRKNERDKIKYFSHSKNMFVVESKLIFLT